jgi:hypothetical protein
VFISIWSANVGQNKAERYKNSDGGAGEVLGDERADRRLGGINKSPKHAAAPYVKSSNCTGDKACDGCDRKRRHWLIFNRFSESNFHVAGDLLHPFAG